MFKSKHRYLKNVLKIVLRSDFGNIRIYYLDIFLISAKIILFHNILKISVNVFFSDLKLNNSYLISEYYNQKKRFHVLENYVKMNNRSSLLTHLTKSRL